MKTFILDSNVLLHEPKATFTLSQNNTNRLIIPITVLEELDKHKTGITAVNYNARDFIRTLEDNKIHIEVDIKKYSFPSNISLEADKPDNKILACALHYKNSKLITKDINLRMKARAIHVESSDFNLDKTTYENYSGCGKAEVKPDQLETLYKLKTLPLEIDAINNQYLLVINEENKKQTALAKYNASTSSINLLPKRNKIFGLSSKNIEQTFAIDALLDVNTPLVALTGLSGSGKTLLS